MNADGRLTHSSCTTICFATPYRADTHAVGSDRNVKGDSSLSRQSADSECLLSVDHEDGGVFFGEPIVCFLELDQLPIAHRSPIRQE